MKGCHMSNYEKLKKNYMQDAEFVKMYDAARMKGAIRHGEGVWHVEATPAQCQIELSQDGDETLSLVIIGTNAHQITQAIFMKELAR